MTISSGKNHHLNLLCSHITEKTGIGFDERKRKQLEEIVENRCRILGLSHMEDYGETLLISSRETDEFSTLMEMLTIQESFFFRQEAQFHAFRHFCLPLLMDKKKAPGKKVNIWSAGCAGGEEAYSIAMVIRDLVPENPRGAFYIKGTDISPQALRKAEEGVYTERAVRGLSSHYLNRYFTKQQGHYILSARIRAMVDFECFNLSQKPFPFDDMPRWDIIFCRNVIIYFTTKHSRRLMKNFFSGMADGGFLFAGFSETMRYLNDDFIPIQLGNAFIYQKPYPGKGRENATEVRSKPGEKNIPLPGGKAVRHGLKGVSKRPVHSTAINPPARLGNVKEELPQTTLRPKKIPSTPPKETDTENEKPLDARLSLAQRLADGGETVEALKVLDDITGRDPLYTPAYFLLAMIYRNVGDLDQSGNYLKKVIYLEPDNAPARLHLADIFKAQGRETDAAREYANVISLLENRKAPELDQMGDGITGEAILTAARAHLKMMKKNPP